MYTPQTIIRSNPAGEAAAREQKRRAELETSERNSKMPVFMFQGYGFRPQYHFRNASLFMEGPLCPRLDVNGQPCLSQLTGEGDNVNVSCDVCGFTADLPKPYEIFRQTAHKKYEGHIRYVESGGNIQTLDVPYEAIKATDHDETREIKIKWAQKDGRNMAVIYFIEKDGNGSKTQVFVDLDREEIRYDASDVPPHKVLAMVKAEFPKTKVEIEYKEQKKE